MFSTSINLYISLNLFTHTLILSLSCSLVVARQFESRDDVHGLQLLEQQLTGVRDPQRGNVAGRLTVVTPVTQKHAQSSYFYLVSIKKH